MVKQYTCAVRNGPNGIYAEMAVRDNGAFVLTEDYEALAVKLQTADAALHEMCGESTESNIVKIAEIALGIYDPTPWCSGCNAMRKTDCHCGELASND